MKVVAVDSLVTDPEPTLYVTEGQAVQVEAQGSWCAGGSGASAECFGAEGERLAHPDEPDVLLASANLGALIARIGSGPYFLIGPSLTFTAGTTGVLELLMNDRACCYTDNSGQLRVEVTVWPSGFATSMTSPTIAPASTASGQILDPIGVPIEGAEVILVDPTQPVYSDLYFVQTTATATDGSYHLNVPGGLAGCVLVRAPGWPAFFIDESGPLPATYSEAQVDSQTGVVDFGCTTYAGPNDGIHLTLPSLTDVTGKITGSNDLACRGFAIEGSMQANGGSLGEPWAITDDEGSYELHLVEGYDWDVYVWETDPRTGQGSSHYNRTGSFRVRSQPITDQDLQVDWDC